ncbi:hypothetical protein DVH05_022042 [Phytophthora capsici]|nr:hypothetical protein DVH05_022042 [Phytophthora capsici]
MVNQSFFGPGSTYTIDTIKSFTVVTRFITDDGTATGTLSEITRYYVQDDVSYEMPDASWFGIDDMNLLTARRLLHLPVRELVRPPHQRQLPPLAPPARQLDREQIGRLFRSRHLLL